MTPAEKVAQLFASRNGLRPPIDVRRVLSTLADIEEDDIPLDVDAVFLGKSRHRTRPLVILQRSRPPTRKTFTLGHELGHTVIPWHAGTFFCHTDFNARLDEFATREVEAEANRFSSELLTPSDWVKSIAAEKTTIRNKIDHLKKSGLSALACSFSLIRHTSPGHFFAEVDSSGIVRYSAASSDSPIAPPRTGYRIETSFEQLCNKPDTITSSYGKIYWWSMQEEKTSGASTFPPSRELLHEIFADLGWAKAERERASMSINGIIGVANSKYRKSPNLSFVALLKGRFLERPHLTEIIQHRLFDKYLGARATELRAKKREATG